MSVFGERYAEVYDRLYADKDYAAECALIERLLGKPRPERLVDFGCGTGTHAVELARRGFHVTGVDLSPAMLARAAAKRGPRADFLQGDMRSTELGATFDAVLSLFAALGYLTTNADVAAALANFRRHAKAGAPLLFDCWYGPAVLRLLPERRVKAVGDIRRTAVPELDWERRVCTTHYELQIGNEPPLRESHAMRFFFRDELEQLLRAAGFRLESVAPFPEIDSTLGDTSWNVIVNARAA